MGRQAGAMKRDRWLMTGIIQQARIEKKRKKCCITIDLIDMKSPRNIIILLSVLRINQ
jgi:hypothetical protein